VDTRVPFIPISGWKGDNLLSPSDNMKWWQGVDLLVEGGGDKKVHVHTLVDALNTMVQLPSRKQEGMLRMPVSGNFTVKGVGTVVTGRVEQGSVKPGQEVMFLPTHTASNACIGKVFTVEMHHKSVAAAGPGDNVGLNVKNLDKGNMPKPGDIMVLKTDTSLDACAEFTAQVQILDVPGELKVGYSPIAYIRTAHVSCRIKKINWHMGKSTGKQIVAHTDEKPIKCLKKNETAEVVFEPSQPIVVEPFNLCDGLGRVAIMEGNSAVMLGKVVGAIYKNGTEHKAPPPPVAKAPKAAKAEGGEKKKKKKKAK
jgi:elongation factor 1-alpha